MTMNNTLTFRFAKRSDTALILQFIKELADYEKMLDEVVADEAILETWIFDKQKAEVIFAVVDDYSHVNAPVVADLCTTPVALSAPPNSYQNNSQS